MAEENKLKKLKNLQKKITAMIQEQTKLQGKREQLLDDLKNKFNVKNVAEAEEKVDKLKKEMTEQKKVVEECIEKMESVIDEYNNKNK